MATAETDKFDEVSVREALEAISDGVAEIVEILSDGGKSDILCSEGSVIQDFVKEAISCIGKKDIRRLDKSRPPLLEQITTFIESAEKFAVENNMKMGFVFKMISKSRDKLSSCLNTPGSASFSLGDSSEVGAVGSSEVVKEGAVGVETEKNQTNAEGSYSFKLATPLKEKASFSCQEPGCSYTVSNFRVFKDHMKKKHQKAVSVDAPKVTCLLPHQRGTRVNIRHPMDYICTHLKKVHNISKPTPNHEFRGFESHDNGITWSPVFRLEGEPDPESAHFVSAQANEAAMKLQFDNVPEDDDHGKVDNSQEDEDEVEAEIKGFPVEPEKQKNSSVQDAVVKEDNADDAMSTDAAVEEVDNNIKVDFASVAESKVHQVESEKEKSSVVPVEGPSAPIEIDDELCSSYEGHLAEIDEDVSGGYFELDPKLDSDIESGDDEDFTLNRLRNKAARFQKRINPETPSLADLPENKTFIDAFVKYILQNADSDNEKNPTVPSTTAKLFRHPDSWLVYQKKRNPGFSLEKLTCFHDDKRLVELKDPSDWIDQIAGDDGKQQPIRRKEMYKAYKRLIQYILKLLGKEDFGSDMMSILRRDKIKSNLKDIHAEIDTNKSWNKLQKIIDKDYQELEKARATVKPNEKHNAAVANKTYFSSKEFKARIEKNNQSWENALATNKMGSKEFDTLGQFARHLLAMTDRNRASGYFFKNSDFDARKGVWFPPDHNKIQFDGVPEGWDMFTQPEDGRAPDAWIITLSGREENVKLGQDVEITVLKLAEDWLQKYRDCKLVMWRTIKPSENFFVNSKRKKFGAMVNTAMLKEYAEVTQISKATTNTFRKAMESTIQSDNAMKTRSKDISSHSARTGSKYYDPSKGQFRASAMQYINEGDVNYESETQVPEDVARKRLKLDEEGQKANLEKANQKLQKDPAKRNATRGKNCKVLPAERVYMQKAFAEDGVFSAFNFSIGKFPGEDIFKRSLYRIIDGFDIDEDVQRMRTIEAEVCAVLKKESKEFASGWEGTLDQNRRADVLVAAAIRNSFKLYERNKNDVDDSYFKF